ncbi:MAG TPA: flagellar filament capping protein FliD [Tepidisphaeraceae bacterium]|jgi:flagellar capping protein FliD
MGTITSGVGLVSGLNSKDIIDQLISIEGRKKDLVQGRIDAINVQKTAYTDVTTQLVGLRLGAQQFSKPSFFTAAQTTSSDESVVTATAAKGAAVGSYQFQVARLVQSQQLIGKGMADFDKTPIGAGTLTIEVGGGEVTQTNELADLRGGKGVSRGSIRVTDMTGKQAVIDLSAAVTLDDAVKAINTTVDVNVEAKIVSDRLVLTDKSGGLETDLLVQDVGTTTTAADLGIAGSNILGQITGAPLYFIGRDTKLSTLNDANGVSNTVGPDFKITFGDASTVNVDLGSATTVGEALDAINAAAGAKGTASVAAGGKGLQVVDNTGGGATFGIEALAGSTTAKELGLAKTGVGGTITGDLVQSKLGTVLLKTLNGGSGVTLGTIAFTNRSGVSNSVDLSGAATLQTALDTINNAGAGVKAEINAAGNGVQLTDTSGGTGELIVTDVSGTGAAQLGIAGTFNAATAAVKGKNLQRKWTSKTTTLASFNGGKGVSGGKFRIQAADGKSANIRIDPETDRDLGSVIGKINSAFAGQGNAVTASINATGDGLLLTDNTAGAGKLRVEDDAGTQTAADLGIAGTATAASIDGTREKTITITATDKLGDVQTKINGLGYGVTASIINDGSGAAPFRLSLNANGTGRAGRVTFDTGATKLDTRTLVQAQDAAVFVGTEGAAEPLLITASRNQISGVVKGLNIELHGVSEKPVTVNVTRDQTGIGEALQKFTDGFNALVDKIGEYTKFDTSTLERGPLLGDSSITQVENDLYAMVNSVVPQAGKYRILAEVGLRVGQGGRLEFDADKFNAAYADDAASVEALFTNAGNTIAGTTRLSLLNRGSGVQTGGDGVKDFTATLRDGTSVDVTIGQVETLGQVISALNSASPAKLRAEITDDGRVKLTDLTTGATPFKLAQINASQFIFDLGLSAEATDGVISGKQLKVADALASITGGIGVTMQQRLNRLIDPVSGILTKQNKNLDSRTEQYKDRIEDLQTMLDAKRLRLEKQFSGLESSLSQLQNQQQSLGSIRSMSAA